MKVVGENLTDCELPFILVESRCEVTVFEEFEPFTTYLRYFALVEFGVLFLLLIAALFAYIGSSISKNRKQVVGEKSRSEQRNKFFLYNAFCLFLSAISIAGLWFFAYNGFILDLEFNSARGRINASVLFISLNTFYMSNYSFLPVLNQLMGSFAFDNVSQERFNCGLRIGFIYPFIADSLMCPLIDTVINGLNSLKDRYSSTPTSSRNSNMLNSLNDFSRKLQFYKKSVLVQSIVFCLSLVLMMFPFLTSIPRFLLYPTVYAVFAGQSTIAVLYVFSKFIIPGSDGCFSLATAAGSKIVRTSFRKSKAIGQNHKVTLVPRSFTEEDVYGESV
eukprot:maker-scaffold_8-snap-gene-4.4-mRNA-1 protein AED:0.16 eAED:0.51 QI:136/0/0.33/1/0/0/3/0/332